MACLLLLHHRPRGHHQPGHLQGQWALALHLVLYQLTYEHLNLDANANQLQDIYRMPCWAERLQDVYGLLAFC